MKVIMINGSPNENGNTYIALKEMTKVFEKENVEYEIIHIGKEPLRGCVDCGYCNSHGMCVFNDVVNQVKDKLKDANGLVLGTPVYYASANGTMIAFLDRLFASAGIDLRMKVSAAVAVARRGGISTTFDELNKYFTISEMPVVSSNYWNGVHGSKSGDAALDVEGLSTMRELANNMVFLMKAIELAKKEYGLPEKIKREKMDFIR